MPEAQTLLLDTHAWIWLAEANPELRVSARREIDRVAGTGEILVAAISVWETCMLEAKGKVILSKEINAWFKEALSAPALRLVPLGAEIALHSCRLPGNFHQDPADRFIVATARLENATIVSRDRRLLDYAEEGHIKVIPA